MTNTPETRLWLMAGVVVTTVTEGDETAITLTCTTPTGSFQIVGGVAKRP